MIYVKSLKRTIGEDVNGFSICTELPVKTLFENRKGRVTVYFMTKDGSYAVTCVTDNFDSKLKEIEDELLRIFSPKVF